MVWGTETVILMKQVIHQLIVQDLTLQLLTGHFHQDIQLVVMVTVMIQIQQLIQAQQKFVMVLMMIVLEELMMV
jgi:hypothetical protein